jgi:hypothetical protein
MNMKNKDFKKKLVKIPKIKKAFDDLENDKEYQLCKKIKAFRISLGLTINKFRSLTN